jgi:hypothetical protein
LRFDSLGIEQQRSSYKANPRWTQQGGVQISAVGDCRSASQSASDFLLKARSRQGQGKSRQSRAEQSRAELAWRAVIKDYFWKQSLLHEAPRACGEWLDLAPRPSPPPLLHLLLASLPASSPASLFTAAHAPCSSLFAACCCCCCCGLGLMTAFWTGART